MDSLLSIMIKYKLRKINNNNNKFKYKRKRPKFKLSQNRNNSNLSNKSNPNQRKVLNQSKKRSNLTKFGKSTLNAIYVWVKFSLVRLIPTQRLFIRR